MAKRNEPPPLPSDAQLEVLNIIWDRGEATVGEVWQAFSARRPVARNTVLTLVARLEEKGWLRRRTEGNVLRYSAVVPQADGAAANRPAACRYGLSGIGRGAHHDAPGRRRPLGRRSRADSGDARKGPPREEGEEQVHEPAPRSSTRAMRSSC